MGVVVAVTPTHSRMSDSAAAAAAAAVLLPSLLPLRAELRVTVAETCSQ
jgi:hypothetical protein